MSSRPPAPQNVLSFDEEENITEARNEKILEDGGSEYEDRNETIHKYTVSATSASQAGRIMKTKKERDAPYTSMKNKIGIRGSSGGVEEIVPPVAVTPSSMEILAETPALPLSKMPFLPSPPPPPTANNYEEETDNSSGNETEKETKSQAIEEQQKAIRQDKKTEAERSIKKKKKAKHTATRRDVQQILTTQKKAKSDRTRKQREKELYYLRKLDENMEEETSLEEEEAVAEDLAETPALPLSKKPSLPPPPPSPTANNYEEEIDYTSGEETDKETKSQEIKEKEKAIRKDKKTEAERLIKKKEKAKHTATGRDVEQIRMDQKKAKSERKRKMREKYLSDLRKLKEDEEEEKSFDEEEAALAAAHQEEIEKEKREASCTRNSGSGQKRERQREEETSSEFVSSSSASEGEDEITGVKRKPTRKRSVKEGSDSVFEKYTGPNLPPTAVAPPSQPAVHIPPPVPAVTPLAIQPPPDTIQTATAAIVTHTLPPSQQPAPSSSLEETEILQTTLMRDNDILKQNIYDLSQQITKSQNENTSLGQQINKIVKEKDEIVDQLRETLSDTKKKLDTTTNELYELRHDNMKIVPATACEETEMDTAAASAMPTMDASSLANILEDSYSHVIRSAVKEMSEKNRELAQAFTDAMIEKMTQNQAQTDSFRTIEKTLEKIWSASRTSEAKLFAASDAVETMTLELNKMQDDRKTDKLDLQKSLSEIKKTNDVPPQELKKARDNERLATDSLALIIQQTYTLYFDIKRGLDDNNNIMDVFRSNITKYLSDARAVLQSDTFIEVITKLFDFETQFIYSTRRVDSFKKAIGITKIIPLKITVIAPDAYHNDETSAAMLNSRYQTAMVTSSFLNANALSKLYDAKHILEEAKRFSQTQQELKDAVGREIAVSALNRMNLDLAKLSNSLRNKIMPAINDTTSEAGTLNHAIRRTILAVNGVSILKNVEIIISFSGNVSRGLLADTNLKKDTELKSDLIKLKQFLTNSELSSVLVKTTAEMEIEEREDDMGEVRKTAENVSAAACDFSLNIEEIYNRGVVESYSDQAANAAALIAKSANICGGGGAAAGGGGGGAEENLVISNTLETFLADVKNRASETDNLIQTTVQEQKKVTEQLQQYLEKQAQQLDIQQQQMQETEKESAAARGEIKIGWPGGRSNGNGGGGGQEERGGGDGGGSSSHGGEETVPGGGGGGGRDFDSTCTIQSVAADYKTRTIDWIKDQINKLDADFKRAKSGQTSSPQNDLRAVRESFNTFMLTGYENIREKTTILFTFFTNEATTEENYALLAPCVNIFLDARKAVYDEFKNKTDAFSTALETYATNLQQQQQQFQFYQQRQLSPVTPMTVEETMEEEEKKDLLDTVKWATEAAKVVVGTGISEDTKERTIIASLEDGENVIRMEPVDLSDPQSSTKPQIWSGKDPSLAKVWYEKEEPHVLRAVSEMKQVSGNLTNNNSSSLRFVKRHGITTQGFAYYLNRLSYTESDKTSAIMHPEFMRPQAQAATTAAAIPDSFFDNKEQAFKILASDLMKTLKDNNSANDAVTSSPAIPSKLNMLIYNIFFVDAKVLRNISAACYKFRSFLTAEMKDATVHDGGVRSKLLEATVAILFTACRHVFESVANSNSAMSQLTQVLERRLAAMASRRHKYSPSSAGDEFRVRVCYIMYSYLHRYLKLCIRRVNVCLRSLRSTGLLSKRMMAAPQMAEGVGSHRVSSFEVKYDFSMLYKLLSFQTENILLLSEPAFKTLESTIAALAAFVNDAKLPISDPNQRSTIPLTGNEIVLPAAAADAIDTIHANWNITVLNELSELLTQYSAWLSKNNGEEEEPEKLIRVCRAAAGATVTCMNTISESKDEKHETMLNLILTPVKTKQANLTGDLYKSTKKNAAEAVAAVLTEIIRPNVLSLEKTTKNLNNSTVGSILASTTKAGSIAAAAHVFISGFKDYLHDPEDFWGACVLFPPDGEGTELEGWAKAYNNNKSSQDILEDFSDLSVENNSSMQGLLVPPDFALAHLNNNNNIVNSNNTIRGSNGYDIKTRDGGPPIWWNSSTTETAETGLQSDGLIKYLMPADGVTISVPGRDKLRKSKLLKNALRSNNSSMSYTRPVFDAQFQTNVHFETPRLVLLPRQHQWTCNSGGAVSAAVWNLPSIKLLHQELTLKEENGEHSPILQTINVFDNDINRAIGDIQSCSKEFGSSEDSDNKSSTMAITSAVQTIMSKKRNNDTEGKKYSVVDELALAPALLRRAGTAPFKPAASKACGMFVTPGRGSTNNNNNRSSWWTSDESLMERAEMVAEKLLVLTPSLLDIHPPTERSISNFV